MLKQAEEREQGLWGVARSQWGWNLAGKQAMGGADTTQAGGLVLAGTGKPRGQGHVGKQNIFYDRSKQKQEIFQKHSTR